jgi:hypothetical protein
LFYIISKNNILKQPAKKKKKRKRVWLLITDSENTSHQRVKLENYIKIFKSEPKEQC